MKFLFTNRKQCPNLSVVLLCVCTIIAGACDESSSTENGKLSPERMQALTQQAVQENNQIIAVTSELMNVKDAIFLREGIDLKGLMQRRLGRTSSCQPVIEQVILTDETHYDTLIYSGFITLDYKDGCSSNGDFRKGKVVIDFTYVINYKKDTTFSSDETIRFVNFTQDTITMNGKISCLTREDEPSSLNASIIEITYPDQSTSSWYGKLLCSTPADTERGMEISGNLEGVTRRGLYFTTDIRTPLTFNMDCNTRTPSKGMLDVRVNRTTATLDYGNGSCDTFYSVSSLSELD